MWRGWWSASWLPRGAVVVVGGGAVTWGREVAASSWSAAWSTWWMSSWCWWSSWRGGVGCALVVGVLQPTLAASRTTWMSSVVVVRWTLVVVVPKMHTVVVGHDVASGEMASWWCAANAVLSTVGSGLRGEAGRRSCHSRRGSDRRRRRDGAGGRGEGPHRHRGGRRAGRRRRHVQCGRVGERGRRRRYVDRGGRRGRVEDLRSWCRDRGRPRRGAGPSWLRWSWRAS